MLKYREVQPVVKALCERHRIPYRQESMFKRFARMTDIVVGKTSGRRIDRLPEPRGVDVPLPQLEPGVTVA
jgi:hypothetical protein